MTHQEAYQIGFILAVATLVGASLGYVASLRGQFKLWTAFVAPVAACAANVGLVLLIGFLVPDPRAGPLDWDRWLAGLAIASFGIGVWGTIPAVLASLLFQSHCRHLA